MIQRENGKEVAAVVVVTADPGVHQLNHLKATDRHPQKGEGEESYPNPERVLETRMDLCTMEVGMLDPDQGIEQVDLIMDTMIKLDLNIMRRKWKSCFDRDKKPSMQGG